MIEYLTLNTAGLPINQATLDELGRNNWQLVQIDREVAYFSRVKEPEPQKKATAKTRSTTKKPTATKTTRVASSKKATKK